MFSLIFIIILMLKEGRTDSGLIVGTNQGDLLGKSCFSRNGTEFISYLGIPYAKAPIGDLRFEVPQPPNKWTEIRNATIFPPLCLQSGLYTSKDNFPIFGQEDCLYLNVFSPKIIQAKTKLPVVVFIHGGGFWEGTSNIYEVDYFMDHQIVIVMIQYRLNVFGFLSAANEELPGNIGLKDQVAALHWIQDNIHFFGGDPNQVTLMGHSAGSASVHFHMHSKLSTGLFHRAISQSGTALGVFNFRDHDKIKETIKTLATLTKCPQHPTSEMIRCLKQLPAKHLHKSATKLFTWENEPLLPLPVVVEPPTTEGAFLIENPWNQEVVNKVPWMVGITKNEGALFVLSYLKDPEKLAFLNDNFYYLLPIMLFYVEKLDKVDADTLTSEIRKRYFNNQPIDENFYEAFIQLHTDHLFLFDLVEAVKRHTNVEKYVYLYEHRNEVSFLDTFGKYQKDLGVSHVDELISLFYLPGLGFKKLTEGADYRVSQKMIKYWVNFIATGNPNGENWQHGVWKKSINNSEFLHITTHDDFMDSNLFHDRYSFWANISLSWTIRTGGCHQTQVSSPVPPKLSVFGTSFASYVNNPHNRYFTLIVSTLVTTFYFSYV